MIRMFSRPMFLVLLLMLVINIDEVKPKKKNGESLFSKLRTITSTAVDLYRVLKRIITRPQNVNIMLNELINWLMDGDTHEFDVINANLIDISSKLNWIMMRMEVKFATIEKMISQLPLTIEIDSIKRDLALTIRKIKNLYDVALTCSSDITQHNSVELQNLANTLTGRQTGDLRDSLSKLYDYIVPATAQNLKQSFLDLLNHHVQAKGDTLCGDVQSTNQYLYHLHQLVVTTEMMGQVALTFGYYLQNKLNNVSIDFELKRAQEDRLERLERYFRKFKSSIEKASLSLRPCEPAELIRGETFIEMEKLYRAVLVEDYNLNNKDSCRGTCNTIDIDAYDNDVDGFFCAHLHKCWKLKTSRVCIRTGELRLYEWIEGQDGTIYGKKMAVKVESFRFLVGKKSEIRTFTDYLYLVGKIKELFTFSLYECEYCICTCEGGHESRKANEVRAFSLRPSRSNTAENMVVTGINLSRQESIICIQIKQGKLLPGGNIEENTEEWTDCNLSYSSYEAAGFGPLDYVEGRDFIVLRPNYNYIDLDNIVEQRDSIVTGVKFGLSDSCMGNQHVKLQLEYTTFDFSSGVLNAFDGIRSSSSCHNQKINTADTDSPLNQIKPRDQNTEHSRLNSYVRFGWSSFNRDVGQTTLPLLDAQPVESKPPTPLSGVGLFYKASPGYGGFLAFKIHTLNYGKHMEEEMIEEFSDEKPDSRQLDIVSKRHKGKSYLYSHEELLPSVDGEAPDDIAQVSYKRSKEAHNDSSSNFSYFTSIVILFCVFLRL